ncbi:MAG: Gfo/Idh/MocA family oxidoreductase, partial [Planctomycetes bacterium]|nr:Gfo/Idh/MocA family oxidoreductase [Planctomycetota bacterium]
MAEQLRIGIIGCGGITHGHVQNIAGIREARVVALVDTDPQRIKDMKARHPETKDVPEFSDYREMLKSVELDATEVHTPHTLHFEQIMDSLDKGLHVLTEKPMVCKVVHAKKLIEKAEQAKKVVLVSYQRHYQGPFRYIKQVISSGQLGKVTFVSALQCQDWYRATKTLWRQKLSLSGGGQLNDSGSHLLDIILWTTGLEPGEVTAFIDNLDSEVDINSAVSVKFKGGAQGNISVVGHAPTWWEDITIWGTEGALFYRNGTLRHHVGFGKEVHELSGFPSVGNPDRNFVDAILGRAQVESPATCGLRVIQLTEAAW